MKPQLNRADLLHCLAAHGPEALDNLAGALGYVPRVPEPIILRGADATSVSSAGTGAITVGAPTPAPPPQARFLRPLGRRALAPEEAVSAEPQWFREVEAYSEDDPEIAAPQGASPPRPLPLMPWPRLWPYLKLALGSRLESRRPDLPRLVEMLARGHRPRRLPRRSYAGWAPECQILIDFAEPLRPFWGDFHELRERLPRLRGRGGLSVVAFPEGDPLDPCWRDGAQGWESAPAYSPPSPGTPVLVLGDLGCNDGAGDRRRRWLRLGARLRAAGCRPAALMPCPPRRWDGGLVRLFPPACWDRGARPPRRFGPVPPVPVRREESAGAERLLALLSPAIRVEPALLRAARFLLPADEADVGTEASTWNHPDIHPTLAAFYYEPEAAARYREGFRREPDAALQYRLARLILDHHAQLSPVIAHEEARILAELLGPEIPEPERVEAGRRFQRRIARTCAEGAGDMAEAAQSWIARLADRGPPPEFWRNNPALEAAWVLAHREGWGGGEAPVPPPGLSPLRAAWALGGRREPGWWELRQRGQALCLCPLSPRPAADATGENAVIPAGMPESSPMAVKPSSPAQSVADAGPTAGSPVAILEAAAPYLAVLSVGEPAAPERLRPLVEPLPLAEAPDRFRLRTDREEWEFDHIGKPDWAEAMGRDGRGLWVETLAGEERVRLYWQPPDRDGGAAGWRGTSFAPFTALGRDDYGLYADLAVARLTQRFRWIAPGRFLMGSPETEPERYDDETQHTVVLTRGYWLADTACTQELWRAVMGGNPSRFRDDPDNPVERVSWRDVQEFLLELNRLIPGLAARLPTEAEWEYACRAGTTTPFSFGGNITPAEVNYHGNYPYAGDVKGLYRERTVPVKTLPPNPWGLYEMHGNVWEWCADWWGAYPRGEATDPRGPEEGVDRVLRGGAWFLVGGFARSACRRGYVPGSRLAYVGFRLALGPGASGSGGQAGHGTPAQRLFDWFKRKKP